MTTTAALPRKKIRPTARPSLGSVCANVLVSRNLIAVDDQPLIEEVVTRFSGLAESITSELSRRCLIAVESEAIVREFIRRTVKRYFLKTCGLTEEELGRILGVEKATAHRILKGTIGLTDEHIRKLAA
jgi:antitoxin component HigA of HigAB toxin-antitoxin module